MIFIFKLLFCICGLLLVQKMAFVVALVGFGRAIRHQGLSGIRRPSLGQLSAVRQRTSKLNEWEMGIHGIKGSKKFKRKGNVKKISIPDPEVRNMDLAQGKDIQEGLVIERLGDRLLIQPDKDPMRNIICSQRSRLCDATIVVGDRVDFFEFGADENVGKVDESPKIPLTVVEQEKQMKKNFILWRLERCSS